MAKKKIVLAYSGGLDTTVIIPWLKENYDAEIVAVCANVGQGDDWALIEKRAIDTGAAKCYVEDLTDEFVEDYIWPMVKAGAFYENRYLLGTSIARPIIAKRVVEIALKEGAYAICHGCTGKGNDQVRFELTAKALAPQLEIIAPWRIWDIQSREEEIEYLQKRKIPVPMKKSDSYSRDENLWHLSHEGLELEDPANEPDWAKLLKLTTRPEKAPNTPEYVELEFERGIPVALNGVRLGGVQLVAKLNEIGGRHGCGLIDLVENRVVGMKSRGVYETPGGAIIMFAHEQLEHLCLDKQTFHYKQVIKEKYAEVIYSGEWFTPLREALAAFVDSTQETVSGKVRVKLYKGGIYGAGADSPFSLYNASIASFTTGNLYSHKDATGFINLFGLPLKVRAMMKAEAKSKAKSSKAKGVKDGGSAKKAKK
jgi:argininosuccinate synthase